MTIVELLEYERSLTEHSIAQLIIDKVTRGDFNREDLLKLHRTVTYLIEQVDKGNVKALEFMEGRADHV